uniref:Uncharacterized protein n=1 Tax=viral metagenome TaxID=1070528 RepID=A0A6C0E5G7_9ZZZZ
MSEYIITGDLSKNYIIVKNAQITSTNINLLISYGTSKTSTIDISFETIYDVSNVFQYIKIIQVLGNTNNLTIRQDVIDFSHKIVLLLSGSIKGGLWNKTNDMLARYTSLDRIEYIPTNKNQVDSSYNVNYYDYSQNYPLETANARIEAEFALLKSKQTYIIQPTKLDSEKDLQYNVKTEFINSPPPGINQLFNYILY